MKAMKIFKILFLFISIALALLIGYSIINSLVSYKYEIEGQYDKVSIKIAGDYLMSQVWCLRYFLYYVLVNIVFLLISLFYKRKG
jgi:hypothetical protein